MKIGYGKSRIIWYSIIGVLVGFVLLGVHSLLARITDQHDLLFLVLVPIFAAGLALLARSENAVYRWGSRLNDARNRVNELMLGATQRSGSTSFSDPSLCTCWQELDCDKKDCPVYGKEHARCWLIAGTFCRGQVQGKFAKKLHDCRLCEVYKMATGDPVDEITENFFAMDYLLSEREEQLKEAYEAARARSEKLAGLVSLSEAALSSVHMSELMQNLLESAASFVGADFGWVSLVDSAGEKLCARVGYGLAPESLADLSNRVGEGIIGQAFAGRYIAVAEDLRTDSRIAKSFLREIKASTLISLPLYVREQMLGMLTLGTLTQHQYDEEEKDSLCVAADRIAVAIENFRLAGEVGRDREQVELIEAISRDVGSGDGMHSIYDSFVKHAAALIDFDQASLALWHPETDEIEIMAMQTEAEKSWLVPGLRLPRNAMPMDQVISSKRSLVRDEISGDEYPTDKLLIEEGIQSAVLLPLMSKGEVLGTMNLGSFKPHAFAPETVELLEPVTRQLGLVLDNVRLLQTAKRLSLVDSLTELYNHRFFYESVARELARSEKYGHPVSLMIIDLDSLKTYNEQFGVEEGDNVLKVVAGILRDNVREIDVIARYGGDEFAVLLPELHATDGDGGADALKMARQVKDAIMAQEFIKGEGGSHVLPSIGIAEFQQHADNASLLLEHADRALHEAKDVRTGERIAVADPTARE